MKIIFSHIPFIISADTEKLSRVERAGYYRNLGITQEQFEQRQTSIKARHDQTLNEMLNNTAPKITLAHTDSEHKLLSQEQIELYYEFGIEPPIEKLNFTQEFDREIYAIYGIEPFLPSTLKSTFYFVMSEGGLSIKEHGAINDALDEFMFGINTLEISHLDLWDIVYNEEGAGIYADCKNYDFELMPDGASFIVGDQFESPRSLDFT
ncbi:MAG TPA: hypothetical protein PK633_14015, partial [Agitococcus sp.]|nr:hypothetical protein [Agitococcus sp.]